VEALDTLPEAAELKLRSLDRQLLKVALTINAGEPRSQEIEYKVSDHIIMVVNEGNIVYGRHSYASSLKTLDSHSE